MGSGSAGCRGAVPNRFGAFGRRFNVGCGGTGRQRTSGNPRPLDRGEFVSDTQPCAVDPFDVGSRRSGFTQRTPAPITASRRSIYSADGPLATARQTSLCPIHPDRSRRGFPEARSQFIADNAPIGCRTSSPRRRGTGRFWSLLALAQNPLTIQFSYPAAWLCVSAAS